MDNQAKLIGEENQNTPSEIVEDLIKNPVVFLLIHDLPLLSFFVANIFIFLTIDHYLSVNQLISLFIFLIGFILSIVIIKTHYFLEIKSIPKRISNVYQYFFDKSESKSKQNKLPKIRFGEIFAFISRNFFFNLLNDSFILLIYWLLFFAILIKFSVASIPDTVKLSEFSLLIGVIGIISGLFQFYVKDYKEKSKEIINSMVKNSLASTSKISFSDFKQFLKDNKNNSLLKNIDDVIRGRYFQGQSNILPYTVTKGRSSYQIINVYNHINRPIDQDNLQLFVYFENYPEDQKELKKQELLHRYRLYLQSKQQQIKNEEKSEKIKELRKLLFTTIIFSDDMLFSYLKFFSDIPENIPEPESFSDYYSNFILNVIYDLFHDVLFFECDKKTDK
ncbi:MAG: hypothetical protein PHO78_05920 [Methanomicrobium sp.]|nr:hypothetical protein [Methanomicrobium sp.]